MLNVEIRNENSAFYKGYILFLKEDSAKVKYENSTQEHVVPLNYLREPSDDPPLETSEVQVNDELEVYMSTREGEPPAWWRSKVKKKGDKWLHLDIILPDGSRVSEVVDQGTFRKLSRKLPLTRESFCIFEFQCNDERILELAKEEEIHKDFRALVGPCLVLPDENKHTLLAISLDPGVHRKITLLFDTHVQFLKARSQLSADIERASVRLEQTKLTGTSGITETFTIKQDFVGLAIGSRGVNITAARELPGINSIELHPKSADPNVYEVLINGSEQKAIQKARSMLEFVEEPVMVPEELISRVIGRNGRMLQEIVDKTQVLKIRIEDIENKDEDQERMVPLWCIGSRDAFELAKMMIEYKIKTLKDLESVKDERDKLANQLQSQGVSALNRLGPPFRGSYNTRGSGYPRERNRPAMPIRGQPYRGRGGFRGFPMRGGRGPPRRGFPTNREIAGDHEFDEEGQGYRGPPPNRGRGLRRGANERGARQPRGGQVGADGDKRTREPNEQDTELPPSNTMSVRGEGGGRAPNSDQSSATGSQDRNKGAAAQGSHGARGQRSGRRASGEAGKMRTHDGDEDEYLNGNEHGYTNGNKTSLPNGNVPAKPVNGVPATT